MKYEQALYIFIILFIIIFIIDYLVINKRKLKSLTTMTKKKGKKKKNKTIGELDYLITKFKLNEKLLNKEKVIIWISIINSFIISIVSSIIMLMPFKMMWQLIIAFVLLFCLIYSLYEIYGHHLKNKEQKPPKESF